MYLLNPGRSSHPCPGGPDEGAGWFNGDDAVALRKGTTLIDVIGQIRLSTPAPNGEVIWPAHRTTRCAGCRMYVLAMPDESNVFDPSVEWAGYATNTFDGLGAHVASCNGGPADPVINEFSASTTGTDVEYVEIFGLPDTDYRGLHRARDRRRHNGRRHHRRGHQSRDHEFGRILSGQLAGQRSRERHDHAAARQGLHRQRSTTTSTPTMTARSTRCRGVK